MGNEASKITKKVLEYCHKVGHYVVPIANSPYAGRRNTRKKGIPDLLGITRVGNPLALEVKSESDKQRPEQKEFQEEWTRRGGIYLIVNSVDDLIKNNL